MISPLVLARQRDPWRKHRRTGRKPGPLETRPCPMPGCSGRMSAENTTGVCGPCQVAGSKTIRKLVAMISDLRKGRAA